MSDSDDVDAEHLIASLAGGPRPRRPRALPPGSSITRLLS